MHTQATRKLDDEIGVPDFSTPMRDDIDRPEEIEEIEDIIDTRPLLRERVAPAPSSTPLSYSGTLGARLRTAREDRRMSVQEVADRLYLERRLIEALETDDFSHMPPLTFVQGYVRSYAKLLDLPAEPFLQTFREQVGDSTPDLNYKLPRDIPEAEVSSRDPWFKILTFLLIVGGIVMVVLWWYDAKLPIDFSAFTSFESSEPATDSPRDNLLPVPEISMESQDSPQLSLTMPPSDGSENTPALDYEPPAEDLGAVDMEILPAVSPAGPALPTAPAVAEEAPPVAEAAPAAAKPNTLVVRAQGDSWTEISGAGGVKIFTGTIKAGDTREFTGTPPLQVKFGRAQDVSAEYEGKAIDLSGRSGIVRLTLPQ